MHTALIDDIIAMKSHELLMLKDDVDMSKDAIMEIAGNARNLVARPKVKNPTTMHSLTHFLILSAITSMLFHVSTEVALASPSAMIGGVNDEDSRLQRRAATAVAPTHRRRVVRSVSGVRILPASPHPGPAAAKVQAIPPASENPSPSSVSKKPATDASGQSGSGAVKPKVSGAASAKAAAPPKTAQPIKPKTATPAIAKQGKPGAAGSLPHAQPAHSLSGTPAASSQLTPRPAVRPAAASSSSSSANSDKSENSAGAPNSNPSMSGRTPSDASGGTLPPKSSEAVPQIPNTNLPEASAVHEAPNTVSPAAQGGILPGAPASITAKPAQAIEPSAAAATTTDSTFRIRDVADGSCPATAFDKAGQLHLSMQGSGNNVNVPIIYTKSKDGTQAWTPPVEISYAGTSSLADIVVDSAGVVNVAWGYKSDHKGGLLVARSLDGGQTWAKPIDIAGISDLPSEPDIAVGADNSIHLTWTDKTKGGNPQILYSVSKDSGATWSKAENISDSIGSAGEPALAVSEDGTVYTAWSEASPDSDHPDIYLALKKSNSWTKPEKLSNGSYAVSHPDLSCGVEGKVHVCWAQGTGSGNAQYICYRVGNNRGHFGKELDLSDTSGVSSDPALVTDQGRVAVAWSHIIEGTKYSDILGRASLDDGKNFSPVVSFSGYEGRCVHPDIAIAGSKVFVVWEERLATKSVVKSTSVEIKQVP